MQALSESASQILDGFADGNLSAGTPAFLFLDFLQVAVDRAFRAGIA
jgi:hypothetical protein